MYNALCHSGSLGSLGNPGLGGWVGLVLNLALWIGLIASLALLVFWVIRRTLVPAGGQPTAEEILRAQYARGEITREQFSSKNEMLDKQST